MYSRPEFTPSSPNAAFALIERQVFGTLVTSGRAGPVVSHPIFMLDRLAGPNGTLFSHLATANEHSELIRLGLPSVAIFLGDHGLGHRGLMPRKFSRRYVSEDSTDGVLRFYFRKAGYRKVRLPGLPGSDEFNKVYYACLDGTYAENAHGPKLSTKGTFRWLSEQYFGSAEFKQLDGRTQHVRRQILEACWHEPIKPGATRTFDDMPLSAFNSKAVRDPPRSEGLGSGGG